MKRTLKIVAIAAAMIAFVACGKKSHDEVKKSPESTESTVVLPTGEYTGTQDIGVYKVATTTDEHKKILSDLKKEKKDLEASMNKWLDENGIDPMFLYQEVTVEKVTEDEKYAYGKVVNKVTPKVTMLDKAVTARIEANQSAISRLDATIAEIEKELIDFKITYIGFTVSKDVDGNYKVSKLVINTDKDAPDYAKDAEGNIVYRAGMPVMFGETSKEVHKWIPKGFIFGNPEMVDGGKVNYHAQSGSLAFSSVNKGVKYTFTGQVKTDEKGESVISGNMEVKCDACDGTEWGKILQNEPWKVSLLSPISKPEGAVSEIKPETAKKGVYPPAKDAVKAVVKNDMDKLVHDNKLKSGMAKDAGASAPFSMGSIPVPAIASEEEKKEEKK